MQNNNRITKEDAQIWANALRSGEYKQGMYQLQSDNGHCCLGVACEVFIPKDKQNRNALGGLIGGMPFQQENAPRWLCNISDDLYRRMGVSFSKLNDTLDYSFDDIANLIELVYVHGALDEEEVG